MALAAAVARPRLLPEAVDAAAGAALLIGLGATASTGARHAVSGLGSTVSSLRHCSCSRRGAGARDCSTPIGSLLAVRAGGSARRLLALVFAVAAAVTVVLSLDATVVLLTPIVFVTAAQLRTSPRLHVFACAHLANSASLLLPVSNLTNLLAFHASGLSFTRFAGAHGVAVDGRPGRRVGGPLALFRAAAASGSGARHRTAPDPLAARPLRVLALTLPGSGSARSPASHRSGSRRRAPSRSRCPRSLARSAAPARSCARPIRPSCSSCWRSA